MIKLSIVEYFKEVTLYVVKHIKRPLLLYGIAATSMLSILLLSGKDVPVGLQPLVYAIIVLLLIIVIVDAILGLKTGVTKEEIRWFEYSDSAEFRSYVEKRIQNCHNRFILIGTGLNILQGDTFLREVLNLSERQQFDLEIYLADPESSTVESRLIEEETGAEKPPVAKSGLKKRIDTLHALIEKRKFPPSINIKLFKHYPTFAMMIIDNEYLVYPYAHAVLGNYSPVFRYSTDNKKDIIVTKFFDKHYQNVKSDAQSLIDVYNIRQQKYITLDKLYPIAIFFIPHENSGLYTFGSNKIGYDIRKKRETSSSWKEQVGSAHNFGFHLTICDVLYFMNENDAKIAKAEVEFIASELRPFEITNLAPQKDFPNNTSIAITGDDTSGILEILHYELVNRVYRRAVASNYSLKFAEMDRDENLNRNRSIIERYKAPYILHQYKGHFTLLTKIPEDKREEIFECMQREFDEQIVNRDIRVEKLAIMTCPKGEMLWEIEKEIPLG